MWRRFGLDLRHPIRPCATYDPGDAAGHGCDERQAWLYDLGAIGADQSLRGADGKNLVCEFFRAL